VYPPEIAYALRLQSGKSVYAAKGLTGPFTPNYNIFSATEVFPNPKQASATPA
jgi:hypothetical protein